MRNEKKDMLGAETALFTRFQLFFTENENNVVQNPKQGPFQQALSQQIYQLITVYLNLQQYLLLITVSLNLLQ